VLPVQKRMVRLVEKDPRRRCRVGVAGKPTSYVGGPWIQSEMLGVGKIKKKKKTPKGASNKRTVKKGKG